MSTTPQSPEDITTPVGAVTEVPSPPQRERPRPLWLRFLIRLWRALMWCFDHWRISLSAFAIIILLVCGTWCYRQCTSDGGQDSFGLTTHSTVVATPEEIRAIRDIGQWEFLSVETEEMVEKHAAHLLGDSHLVCIYRGTLRLGIDMQYAGKDWFEAEGDNAILRLPDVTLLDENFIDEARTVTFHQQGNWKAEAREQLRNDAAKAMKARTLTADNLEEARRSAREQFTKIFTALGFASVEIYFERPKQ